MKIIHVELKNYNRRADNTVSLKVDSLIELTSDDIAEIDSHRGCVGVIVLTDSIIGNEIDIDIDDILKNMPQNDAIGNYKTPSKRFRDVLYRLYEQKLNRPPTEQEFADYYDREYKKIIEHYKDKFEDDVDTM